MVALRGKKKYANVPCLPTFRSGIFVGMTIGERIRSVRESMKDEKGRPLSRARFVDLMEDSGVRRTEKTLANWETGFEEREPTLTDLEAIAKVTGRSVYWFLTGEAEPPAPEPVFDLRKWLDDPNATWEGKPVTDADKAMVEALFRRFYEQQEKR